MPTNSLSPRGDDGTAKAEAVGINQEVTSLRSVNQQQSPQTRIQPKPRRMCYEFPLRADFAAQIVLPYDLTRNEAKRLRAFLRTVAGGAR